MLTYEDLDVRPVINALGTVTVLGGSTMPAEVTEAMAEAARHYVPIRELEEAAGAYIARRLGVEAAFISSGAAAGLTLAAAACMAGTNPAYRAQLPDTNGLKNEIIIFRSMRCRYDQALRVAGARLVEIGLPRSTEVWELEAAFSPQTAAVAYIAENEYLMPLPLATVVRVAHARGVPVIVDAAAELPPVENLWKYIHQGADIAIFSGGKDIRGPQSAGLLVGRRSLIEACAFHAAPNHALGRGMKVGKEEIMGFVTALDLYLAQDFEQELARWEAQVRTMVSSLAGLPGVTARRVFPGEPGVQPVWIPRAHIEWTPEVNEAGPQQLQERLLHGQPRVAVGANAAGLVVNPQMLEPGQEQVVADCIKRVLTGNT